MNKVQGFQLFFTAGPQAFQMPDDAVPLCFTCVDNNATLYALVDSEADKVTRYFLIAGTGDEVPDRAHYLGTDRHIELHWHLFEVPAPAVVEQNVAPPAVAEESAAA